MPLVKIHVEHALFQERQEQLASALKPIRVMLCDTFHVDASLCQLSLIPVWGVDDQAPVAAEIQILPKPERTRALIEGACERLRDALSQAAGARAVIRSTQLDPATYLALK